MSFAFFNRGVPYPGKRAWGRSVVRISVRAGPVRATILRRLSPALARGKAELSIDTQPEDRMFNMDHFGQKRRLGGAARRDRSKRKAP